ncbi:MAG: ATP-binding protein [Candidatus Cryptobacteroides sp.]
MNRKLLPWLSGVLLVFTVLILAVELHSEHNYKKEILESRLEIYADIVAEAVRTRPEGTAGDVTSLMPDEVRVSVILPQGKVVYDTGAVPDSLEDHSDRPEVRACLEGDGQGCFIRNSETADDRLIYFAKNYGTFIVRTALPFRLSKDFLLRPDFVMLLATVFLFMLAVLATVFISRRFSNEAEQHTTLSLRQQKHQMTNNIAHELRTPVTSIRGYLETLVNNPDIDSEHRSLFLNRAYDQTLRLSELIRDISLITKMEEAPQLLSREYVGLRSVIDEVLGEFAGEFDARGIEVRNNVREEISLKGNRSLIYALYRNLVENTLRYAGDGVTVELGGTTSADGFLHLNYSDNGVGVPPESLDRIFERFFRIGSSDQGSGLGLSIVRNAVLFHGGTITASNVSPHGLRFDFILRDE